VNGGRRAQWRQVAGSGRARASRPPSCTGRGARALSRARRRSVPAPSTRGAPRAHSRGCRRPQRSSPRAPTSWPTSGATPRTARGGAPGAGTRAPCGACRARTSRGPPGPCTTRCRASFTRRRRPRRRPRRAGTPRGTGQRRWSPCCRTSRSDASPGRAEPGTSTTTDRTRTSKKKQTRHRTTTLHPNHQPSGLFRRLGQRGRLSRWPGRHPRRNGRDDIREETSQTLEGSRAESCRAH